VIAIPVTSCPLCDPKWEVFGQSSNKYYFCKKCEKLTDLLFLDPTYAKLDSSDDVNLIPSSFKI